MTQLIIIGTGLAGYSLVKEIRRRDTDIKILLITRDDGASYSKPMLSNALSKNKHADDLVIADAAKMAKDLAVEILTETEVTGINAESQLLECKSHDQTKSIHYDKLVLANGANVIQAPVTGDAAEEIFSVNDLIDYRAFRQGLEEKQRVLIIGAGMIGCEFANDLAHIDAQVHVVGRAPQILASLLPEAAAAQLQKQLSTLGVSWSLGASIEQLNHKNDVLTATLTDGSVIACDRVLSAIGLEPNLSLATMAGLETGRGIKVNTSLQTSNSHIYALGDCAEVDGLALPFVMPLMNCARALAASITGEPTEVRYPAMPVALKTPCHPTIVCPPVSKGGGNWRIESESDNGLCALYEDGTGQLLGFVLMGDKTAEKAVLSKQIPDWIA